MVQPHEDRRVKPGDDNLKKRVFSVSSLRLCASAVNFPMLQTARPSSETPSSGSLPDVLQLCEQALAAAEAYQAQARSAVLRLVARRARSTRRALDREQRAAHGLSWLATYVTALRETLLWAQRLPRVVGPARSNSLICQAAFGEYLAQIKGGIAMSQGEVVRPPDLDAEAAAESLGHNRAVQTLTTLGCSSAVLMRIAALIADGAFGDSGLDDEALLMVRDQFSPVRRRPSRSGPRVAQAGRFHPAAGDRGNWPGSASSASPSRRNMAAPVSASSRCASSRRS